MGWILDTSIPDIYTEDTVQGNLHTCFEAPYPAIFWYVNQTNDDVQHLGELDYHTPCFSPEYPSVFWYVENDDVVHGGEVYYISPCFDHPFPYVFWYPTNTPDVTHDAYWTHSPMGAFLRCTNLSYVRIPPEVKRIGPDVFKNTNLTLIKVPEGCLYQKDAFPEGCEIQEYPIPST